MNLREMQESLDAAIEKLEQEKKAIEDDLKKLQAARAALNQTSSHAQRLLNDEDQQEDEEQEETSDALTGTNFEKIVAFLQSQGNEPQSAAEIEAGTGAPRTSVAAVLYRTHWKHFVRIDPEPGSPSRAKKWRLRDWKPAAPSGSYDEPESISFGSGGDDEIPF